jgi:hypothetical protein
MSSTVQPAAVPNRFTGVTDLIHTMRKGAGADDLGALLQNQVVRLYHGSSTDPSASENRSLSAMGAGLYLTSRDRAVDYAVFRSSQANEAPWRADEKGSSFSFSPVLSVYTIRAREIKFYICHRERCSTAQLCHEWRTFLREKVDNPPLNAKGNRLYRDPRANWNHEVNELLRDIVPGFDIGGLIRTACGELLFPEFMQSKGYGGIAAFEGHDGTCQRGPTVVIFNRSDSRVVLEGSHTFNPSLAAGKAIKSDEDLGKIKLPEFDPMILAEGNFTPIELQFDGQFKPLQLPRS